MLKVLMKQTGIGVVNQWIGISYDELHRMKKHPSSNINNIYPLVDLKIDRADCRDWLKTNKWHAVKSSCIGCPYHSNRTWEWLKQTAPDDFNRAVQFDKDIRKQNKEEKALNGTLYLHRKCEPLNEIDFMANLSKKTTQIDDDFKFGFAITPISISCLYILSKIFWEKHWFWLLSRKNSKTISVRRRFEGNLGEMKLKDYIKSLKDEIKNKDRRDLK